MDVSTLFTCTRTRMLLLPPSPIAQGVSIALLFLNPADLCVMSLDSNDGHLFGNIFWFWCVLFSMPFEHTHNRWKKKEMPPPQCFHNRRYKQLRWLHHPFSKYMWHHPPGGWKIRHPQLPHRFHLLHDWKLRTRPKRSPLTTILLPPNIHSLSSTPQTGITFLHHPHRRYDVLLLTLRSLRVEKALIFEHYFLYIHTI